MLERVMHGLERRLHARDMGHRTSHPFEWGLAHLEDLIGKQAAVASGERAASWEVLRHLNRQASIEVAIDKRRRRAIGSFFRPRPRGESSIPSGQRDRSGRRGTRRVSTGCATRADW